MLLSLSLILILGFSLSGIFNRLKLPGLMGMILTGYPTWTVCSQLDIR